MVKSISLDLLGGLHVARTCLCDLCSQIKSQAATWEKKVLEAQEKCTAAEARAKKDADTVRDKTAQLTELEAKLSEGEQHWQADQRQGATRAREYEALEQRVRELKAQVETDKSTASEQLAAVKAARDQLQAECNLHRERAEQEAADSAYDKVSAKDLALKWPAGRRRRRWP